MKVGFTGTQQGMNEAQLIQLNNLIFRWYSVEEAHHGDCTGADAEFHKIFNPHTNIMHAHPSNIESKRAFCKADVIHDPLPPLERNKIIVDSIEVLIAAPFQDKEIVRSGTWATIRAARKAGLKVHQLLR